MSPLPSAAAAGEGSGFFCRRVTWARTIEPPRGEREKGLITARSLVLAEKIWQAPLVPAALALTAGIVLDRHANVSLGFSLMAAAAGVAAWAAARSTRWAGLALVYLACAILAVGAGYHHAYRHVFPANDIGNYASAEPRLARLHGELAEEPIVRPRAQDSLQSYARPDPAVAILRVTHLRQGEDWLPVSGRTRLLVPGPLLAMHVGDQVEAIGMLSAPPAPANPGEFDYASFLLDQRIRAQLVVHKTSEGVTRTKEGWPWSLGGWLAVVRAWGQRELQQTIPEQHAGIAMALLLGEGSTMTTGDWEKYIRTGVIHVLAISGQHLVILAGFLWIVLRLLGMRRRRGAWLVAVLLLAYALLTGGHPSVLRSAVTVCVVCGGILLSRPVLPANSFALAWIIVAVLNPTDLFSAGCQLSFLAVALLYWGTSQWFVADADALDRLIDEGRPAWQRCLRWLGRIVALSYAVTAVIWLASAPLVAGRYHLVSPAALVLGPPLILLTSIALLSGFLLLLSAVIAWPLVPLFAEATSLSLAGCDFLVRHGDRLPGCHFYVADIPHWWLWGFYLGLLLLLTLKPLQHRWREALLAGLAWLCIGLYSTAVRPSAPEMRCTFLAVGHGGCIVIETPEGRTLLYDAGALNGPDVTRRQIAPFLWSRNIRRIDEVLLSHADLDHFNGMPALLERFAVGQVSCTPTFSKKTTPGVGLTLDALRRLEIPMRIVQAGDRLVSGTVTLEVLHPPAQGPDGKENVRSLVLLVQHAGHTILLTGDLEGAGQERVLALPPVHVDVLMAPHHGGEAANKPDLARWAQPRVVVACQGPPRWPSRAADSYTALGADFLGTWPNGAVTFLSRESGLEVDTFVCAARGNERRKKVKK